MSVTGHVSIEGSETHDCNLETTTEDVTTTKRSQASRRSDRAAVAGLAVGVGATVGAQAHTAKPDLSKTFEAAREAACKFGPNLGNYDGANMDPFFKNLAAGATGDALKRFQDTSGVAELRTVLAQAKAKSIVDQTQCGVRGGSKTDVDVVMVMSARSGSIGTQSQMVPKQIGVVATMTNVNGKWLVSKLDAPFLTQ